MEKTIRAVGQRIKQLRLQKNLTLEELANRSGCTAGFLSNIEQNRAVPSVVTLDAIAQALGTRIADFFPETIHTAKIVRHDQRESFHFEGSSVVYSLLSSKFSHATIEAFLMTIVSAREALPTDEMRAHVGEEFCYVLQGVLRLWYGETFFDLYPGDSAHFRSMVRHRLENRSDHPVVLLSLITPAIF